MSRAVWKGTFEEQSIIKKEDKQKNQNNKKFTQLQILKI